MKTLIAAANTLKIEKIVSSSTGIAISLTTVQVSPSCPSCERKATKVHSRYDRQLSDLPWEGIAVRLHLKSRKWFCHNPDCEQGIFCERLPELVAPYGRKTLRLNEVLLMIGFALGGRAGSRATQELALRASARTLLRRVRARCVPTITHVTKLGVDDFALRRGQRYGTILVDLERHRVIDLLPDRDATHLEQWLKKHPEVEVVSRDRALAYAEAARKGAPQAVQVADRFHLMKNLTEAFEKVVQRHAAVLRQAAQEVSPRYLTVEVLRAEGLWPEHFPAQAQQKDAQLVLQAQRRAQRLQRYESVKQLRAEGYAIAAIARKLGMHRETVRGFVRAATFPERAPAYRRVGEIQQQQEYLRKRWAEGCFNARQLYREIKQRGFTGCEATVKRCVQRWRAKLPLALQHVHGLPDFSPPTPRQAVWWLLKPEKLETQQQEYLNELQRRSPEIQQAQSLVKEFQRLLAGRRVTHFEQWRDAVEQSGIGEIKSFAVGLQKDEAAVRAAMTYDWNNGMVEGKVNKLKMLKRQMYGRANLDLLRARVLQAT